MSREQTNEIIEDLKKRFESGKVFLSTSFGELFTTLIETLQISRDRKFVFLLVGRTGVGKSSTVNTLMGKEVARVNPFEPSTMMVELYDSEIDCIQFTVIDTPGLCMEFTAKQTTLSTPKHIAKWQSLRGYQIRLR